MLVIPNKDIHDHADFYYENFAKNIFFTVTPNKKMLLILIMLCCKIYNF